MTSNQKTLLIAGSILLAGGVAVYAVNQAAKGISDGVASVGQGIGDAESQIGGAVADTTAVVGTAAGLGGLIWLFLLIP